MGSVSLHYSPDEGIWYYQKTDYEGKVSVKEYETREAAIADYANTYNPSYEWE